jgi:hypothetical protein
MKADEILSRNETAEMRVALLVRAKVITASSARQVAA